MGFPIDQRTAIDIDRRVKRLLKETGLNEPPVDLTAVIEHLSIDHSYYDLTDPSLLREFVHKLKIGSAKATAVLKKVSLKGLWLPDSQRIIVDQAIPKPKLKWVNAHEISHRLIPTHNSFFLGDTAATLDPDYHEMLEAEANYGASSLIFMADHFTSDALDCKPIFQSLELLSKRYGNSLATTLRRFVQFSYDVPMLGVISTPSWLTVTEPGNNRCRYFITSSTFEQQFSGIRPEEVLKIIDSYVSPRSGGVVGESSIPLKDDNDRLQTFRWQSFFNKYDLLTLAVCKRSN